MLLVTKELPVVIGGPGLAIDTSSLSSLKLVKVAGLAPADSLSIDITADGDNWYPVKTFLGSNGANQALRVNYPAKKMRIGGANVTAGPPTVVVEAFASMVRSIALPTPVLNGIGASVDVREFGTLTTLALLNLDAGKIRLEISDDNATFSPFYVFDEDDAVVKNLVANFIRAVSIGASSADISISSETPQSASRLVELTYAGGLYLAQSGDIILADSKGGPIVVTAPPANVKADQFIVKDFGGKAFTCNITVVPDGTDTVEEPVLNVNKVSKTWISDGAGNWVLI